MTDIDRSFELDYIHACERNQLRPLNIRKIRPTAPLSTSESLYPSHQQSISQLKQSDEPSVIPIALTSPRSQTSQTLHRSETEKEFPKSHKPSNTPFVQQSSVAALQSVADNTELSHSKIISTGAEAPTNSTLSALKSPAFSYQFIRSMTAEHTSESEEDLHRIQIRGWRVTQPMLETIMASVVITGTANCFITELTFVETNITRVTLDMNPVSTEQNFALLLSEESQLRSLALTSNRISDFGMAAIAQALKYNRCCLVLNFWGNCLKRAGAQSLAEAMTYNNTLLSLSVAKNRIGDEGVDKLSKMFVKHAITSDELQQRKRFGAEIQRKSDEKQRQRDSARRGSAVRSEDSLAKKDTPNQSQTSLKRTPAVPKPAALGSANSNASTTKNPITKKHTAESNVSSSGQSSTPNTQTGISNVGASAASIAAASTQPASLTLKNKTTEKESGKLGAGSVGSSASAKGKSTASSPVKLTKKKDDGREETSDETDAMPTLSSSTVVYDGITEADGVPFFTGNRTLANLNISNVGMSEKGVRVLFEALRDQESNHGGDSDIQVGLMRVSLQGNMIESSNPMVTTINNMLKSRNLYTPSELLSSADGDRGREDDGVVGISASSAAVGSYLNSEMESKKI